MESYDGIERRRDVDGSGPFARDEFIEYYGELDGAARWDAMAPDYEPPATVAPPTITPTPPEPAPEPVPEPQAPAAPEPAATPPLPKPNANVKEVARDAFYMLPEEEKEKSAPMERIDASVLSGYKKQVEIGEGRVSERRDAYETEPKSSAKSKRNQGPEKQFQSNITLTDDSPESEAPRRELSKVLPVWGVRGDHERHVYETDLWEDLNQSFLFFASHGNDTMLSQVDRIREILKSRRVSLREMDLCDPHSGMGIKAIKDRMMALSGREETPQLFLRGNLIGVGREALEELMFLIDSGQNLNDIQRPWGHDMSYFEALFKRADADADGFLNRDEFAQLIADCRFDLSARQIAAMMAQAEYNHAGLLEYDQLIPVLVHIARGIKQIDDNAFEESLAQAKEKKAARVEKKSAAAMKTSGRDSLQALEPGSNKAFMRAVHRNNPDLVPAMNKTLPADRVAGSPLLPGSQPGHDTGLASVDSLFKRRGEVSLKKLEDLDSATLGAALALLR